jgi:hypothetical protein
VSFDLPIGFVEIFLDGHNPALYLYPGHKRAEFIQRNGNIQLNQNEMLSDLSPSNIENWLKRILELRAFL